MHQRKSVQHLIERNSLKMKFLVGLLSWAFIFPFTLNGQDDHLNFPDTMFLKWGIQSQLDLINEDGEVCKRFRKLGNEYMIYQIRQARITRKSIVQLEKGRIVKWVCYDDSEESLEDLDSNQQKFSEFPSFAILFTYKNSRISSMKKIEGLDTNSILGTAIFEYDQDGKLREIISKNKRYEVSARTLKNDQHLYSKTALRTVEIYSEIQYSGNKQIEKIYRDRDLIRIVKTQISGNETMCQEYNRETELLSELIQIKDPLDRVISEEYQVTEVMRNQEMNFILPYTFKYFFEEDRLIFIDSSYSNEGLYRSKARYLN